MLWSIIIGAVVVLVAAVVGYCIALWLAWREFTRINKEDKEMDAEVWREYVRECEDFGDSSPHDPFP